MNKKAQAAIEFLLTYGWAFLIVIGVTTAILTLDPLAYTEKQSVCTTSQGTTCDSQRVQASESELFFTLKNTKGQQQIYKNISAKTDTNTTDCIFTKLRLDHNDVQRVYCNNVSLTPNEPNTIEYTYQTYPTRLGEQYLEKGTGKITTTPQTDTNISSLFQTTSDITLGETTTITSKSGEWQTIQFSESYEDPVLVGARNTRNGADGVIIEFKDITSTSAKARICSIKHNPPGNGCRTNNEETEKAGVLIIDSAKTKLVDGLEAGKLTAQQGIGAGGSQTVSLQETFSSKPYIYASTNIQNGPSPVEARITSTFTSSFTTGLCKMDNSNGNNCDSNHPEEEIHWVAIQPETLNINQQHESTQINTRNANWKTTQFNNQYQNPVVLTEVQGYRGTQDVTVAEAKTITQNQAQIRFCEFDYNGQCDSHSGNTVGNIVFEKGMIKKESQLKLFNPSQNLQAFTQPGTYNFRLPESINSIDVLVVAGGGGGGGRHGGGGGAGGIIYEENYQLTHNEVTLVVGQGGSGGPSNSGKGQNGENSRFDTIEALGGGGGGAHNAGDSGQDGGSGGGESNNGYGEGTPGQGYNGGRSTTGSPWNHGGGGGAGEKGHDATNQDVGNGGDGVYYGDVFGEEYGEKGWFAAGGGGGSHDPTPNTWGYGGKGGGGDGANPELDGSRAGKDATPNTGSGGGGGSRAKNILGSGNGGSGGNGASGIILIKTS